MTEVEFAYFDGESIKGNSKVAKTYLDAVKDLIEKSNITELAFTSGNTSGVLIKEPVMVFVRASGDVFVAKSHVRKVLRELGFEGHNNLEDIFELAEEIENLPIEEVIKKMRK